MSSQEDIIIVLLFTSLFTIFHLPVPMSALPILPAPDPSSDPDPATVQSQISLPATIPAFPEQSQTTACPLDLPENLFHDIKAACDPKNHRLDQSRCCPVLAAWFYSAYSKTGLGLTTTAESPSQTGSYDMPVLPEDSETCVDTLEKALGNRGIELQRPNETCDVVYCYCGIRLHPFSCPEAFRVDTRGKLVGGESVKKLERDCLNGGLGGCSKCLNSLYLLNGDKGGRRSKRRERSSKMHSQDCELMGLTWLLNKNRSAYIHTVSAVLRAIMMNDDDAYNYDPAALCSTLGRPLAVDSSEINNNQSSLLPICLTYQRLLLPLCTTMLFFFARYW